MSKLAQVADLDSVIVNWNSGNYLRECLASIPAALEGNELRVANIFIIDNASSDGSAEELDEMPLSLQVILNPVNAGFARACNQASRLGSSAYILFLNPDCRLLPGSLSKAIRFMEQEANQKVGILGIQLMEPEGRIHRNAANFPTAWSVITQMLGLDRIFPQRFPSHFMERWDHQDSRQVDQVTGAFFLVRREVFDSLHGFDERFFMYFEDLDFAWRARQAGWVNYYLSDVQAIHLGGAASGQIPSMAMFYFLHSRLQYLAKHFGRRTAFFYILATFLVEFWTRLAWNLVRLSFRGAEQMMAAYWKLARSIPTLCREISGHQTQ